MVGESQVGGVEGLNGSDVLPVAIKQVGLDVLAHGLRSWNDLASKIICLRTTAFAQLKAVICKHSLGECTSVHRMRYRTGMDPISISVSPSGCFCCA